MTLGQAEHKLSYPHWIVMIPRSWRASDTGSRSRWSHRWLVFSVMKQQKQGVFASNILASPHNTTTASSLVSRLCGCVGACVCVCPQQMGAVQSPSVPSHQFKSYEHHEHTAAQPPNIPEPFLVFRQLLKKIFHLECKFPWSSKKCHLSNNCSLEHLGLTAIQQCSIKKTGPKFLPDHWPSRVWNFLLSPMLKETQPGTSSKDQVGLPQKQDHVLHFPVCQSPMHLTNWWTSRKCQSCLDSGVVFQGEKVDSKGSK